MKKCSSCDKEIIKPRGNPKSNILLIGEFPGETEMKTGMPFSGGAGRVLKEELFREKVDYKRFRITNLWLHPKYKTIKNKDKSFIKELNDSCLNFSVVQLLKEAEGKDAILLIGSESTKMLANRSVSAWSGLEVESDYLDAPLIMCCPNPAQVFHSPLGEVRLSIHKFVKEIRKRGYYE